MEHIEVGKSFGFDKTGVTKNATFTGPVVLFEHCLVLVPRKVTTENATAAGFFFGVIGALLASMFSSVDKMEYPYPAVFFRDLPEPIRAVRPFRKLKGEQRVVVIRREQIQGYTKSFFTGFRLVCEGESVMIRGSQGKLVNAFTKYGHPELKG